MKVYLLESPKKINIIERKIPDIGKDEVLVKVTDIGLCGSDIHLFNGTYSGPCKYPLLFGHEWSGIVHDMGSNVKKVKLGDKVTGDASKYCGTCTLCSLDKNLCKNIEKFGVTTDGASAEYIVRKEKYIYKAPKNMDLDLICFAEPFSVSSHMISKITRYQTDLKKRTILIYGGGTLGISTLLILKKLYNCRNVYLLDIVKERVKLAKEFGALAMPIELLNSEPDKLDYRSTYSNKIFDIVIEATGSPDVFKRTLELVKPLGIVECLGMMGEVTINQKMIVLKCLTITGSVGGTGEFPKMLNFIKKNKELVKRMISHKISINEISKAFNIGKETKNLMKVQLFFD